MTNDRASESSLHQLDVLARLHDMLEDQEIPYWLFGGWAVDFHAGMLTRPHGDIDIAVWLDDRDRLAELLERQAWAHTPDEGEDGYTCFTHGGVKLEVAFLARDETGRVYTPVRDGRGEWPDETFGDDVVELLGVRAHVIRRAALVADKSVARNDPSVSAKDRADLLSLAHRTTGACQVRDAIASEIDRLATLWYDAWRDAHASILPVALAQFRTFDSFRARLGKLLPAVRVVGPPLEPSGFSIIKGDELYQLFVSAEARGAGVAAALIADAETRLAERGVERAWLDCAIGNDRAARFYEKHGWRRTGVVVSELETPEGLFPLEVWRYEKDLRAGSLLV